MINKIKHHTGTDNKLINWFLLHFSLFAFFTIGAAIYFLIQDLWN